VIVELVASTGIDVGLSVTPWQETGEGLTSPDRLAEFGGRLCYQSWDRPNPATATNASYLANIIAQQHFSVLEHASASFYVAGVSRSLSHELVRHRHLSFSQLSQRFVDESSVDFVVPPLVQEHMNDGGLGYYASAAFYDAGNVALEKYQAVVDQLSQLGLPRKQVREAARAVLPNATETQFLVTGNMRAWREVIAKRISPHADAEIQLFAREVLTILKRIAPNTFQDMEVQ
jgi:thymidylate synthase (FAD)